MLSARGRGRLNLTVLTLTLVLSGCQGGAIGLPPPPTDAQPTRILPARMPLAEGAYAFSAVHPDGSPVVPDPCRPLRWTLNPENLPDGAETEVQEAFDHISTATGLKFVQEQDSSEVASLERDLVQPDRYGDRIVPVLVTFAAADQVGVLGGEVAAVAIPQTITTDGLDSERIATGQVVVDTDYTRQALRTPGGRSRLRMILMHELGHLVGLGHVDDPSAVMAPVAGGFLYFGPGDLQGLSIAGSGRCFDDA